MTILIIKLQFFNAATSAITHASSKLPSRLRHSRSQWRTQTHLEFWMHKASRSIMILLFTNSAMNWVAAWAVSPGGPDLICEEHKGGNVTFGMINPLDGSSISGGAISYKKMIKVTSCNFATINIALQLLFHRWQ